MTQAPREPAETADVTDTDEPDLEGSEEEVEELPEGEPDEPTAGSREAPLALGETRKIATGSAWTVGIVASDLDAFEAVRASDQYHEPPADGEVFVVANVTIQTDAAVLADQGADISEGAEPAFSVSVEFVGNEGRGYDALFGTMCYLDDMLINTGAVYDDGVTVTGNVCIAVPEGEVDGGLWRLSNLNNDAVWVQAT